MYYIFVKIPERNWEMLEVQSSLKPVKARGKKKKKKKKQEVMRRAFTPATLTPV